ncbi:unnamed protein product [Parajaminaea phylloscopi]
MRIHHLSLLSLAAVLATAAPSRRTPFVRKDAVNVPRDWVKRAPASGDEMVDLHLALAKRDQSGLEARLTQISDPAHADYGKWLSKEDVDRHFAPSQETRDVVARWLQEYDVESRQIAKRTEGSGGISVRVSANKARELLGDAEFSWFQHRETGEDRFTTTAYSLPRDVAPHVDAIFGIASFARGNPMASGAVWHDLEAPVNSGNLKQAVTSASQKSAAGAPASCSFNAVTAQCLRDLYGTSSYKPTGKGQNIGVSAFLEEYASFSDLNQYIADQRPDAKGYTFDVKSINGGLNDQSKPGSEANLDVQTVAGVAYPLNQTFYTTAGRPPFQPDANTPTNTNEPYALELEYLLDQQNVPSILSTSYGDDEQTIPLSYAQRVCSDIAGLTARGVSLLYASGDYGVGPDGTCYSNDGKKKAMFLPTFPSACPWVTSVGATMQFNPEVVTTKEASFIVSGSGFSNYFARPDYQRDAVAGYLKKLGNKNQGLYNQTGRAYPDIAAQGSRFKIAVGGKFGAVSGTSASTPLFASIVALLNDARQAKGKPYLGFLNPLIYSLQGQGFNDITSGSATGCNSSGFPALDGWDPATGYGTPKFAELRKLVGA